MSERNIFSSPFCEKKIAWRQPCYPKLLLLNSFGKRWFGLWILFLGFTGLAQPALPNQYYAFPTNFFPVQGAF